MNHIVSTISLSNYLNALAAFYSSGLWKTNSTQRSHLQSLYTDLSNINPNDWYLSDAEEAIIKLVGKALSKEQV